jgi:hypothetical protein
MKDASSEPPSSAPTASGPALNLVGTSLVLPSSLVNSFWSSPTSAAAWVTFGK